VPASPAPSTAPDSRRLLSVTAVPGGRPGHVVVQVTGGVDAYTAPLLQLCLDSQAGQHGLRELVVDLEQVTSFCVDAVTVLAQALRRCRTSGARLVIRTGGRRDVPELGGLADVVPVDPAGVEQPQPEGPRTATRPHPRPRRSSARRPRRICR
jgi:anti-sigma B factor antagonist